MVADVPLQSERRIPLNEASPWGVFVGESSFAYVTIFKAFVEIPFYDGMWYVFNIIVESTTHILCFRHLVLTWTMIRIAGWIAE